MAEKKKKVKWVWEKDHDELEHVRNVPKDMSEQFGFNFPSMRIFENHIAVNVSETSKELIIRAELPGFKKDEIKLVVTKDSFELTAEKKHEEMERGEAFYRREASHSSVSRSFALPVPVDADRVNAKLEEGVLTVTMPKLDAEKKKKKAVEIE